jgi:hypothetical protein
LTTPCSLSLSLPRPPFTTAVNSGFCGTVDALDFDCCEPADKECFYIDIKDYTDDNGNVTDRKCEVVWDSFMLKGFAIATGIISLVFACLIFGLCFMLIIFAIARCHTIRQRWRERRLARQHDVIGLEVMDTLIRRLNSSKREPAGCAQMFWASFSLFLCIAMQIIQTAFVADFASGVDQLQGKAKCNLDQRKYHRTFNNCRLLCIKSRPRPLFSPSSPPPPPHVLTCLLSVFSLSSPCLS